MADQINQALRRVIEAAERLDARQRLSVGLTQGMLTGARRALDTPKEPEGDRAELVEALRKLETLESSYADMKRARTSALRERDAQIAKRDRERERADRLEVENRELEDANRSLAKMRDKALEGKLAVAQPEPKQVEEEGDWPWPAELYIGGDKDRPWLVWNQQPLDAWIASRRYVPAASSPAHEELTMIVLALKNQGIEDVTPERGVEILIERLYSQRADSSPTEEGGDFPLDGLATWLSAQIESTNRILGDTDPDSTDRIRLKGILDAYGYVADRFTPEKAAKLPSEGREVKAETAFRAGFQLGAEEPTRDPNEAYETFLEFTHEARGQAAEDRAAEGRNIHPNRVDKDQGASEGWEGTVQWWRKEARVWREAAEAHLRDSQEAEAKAQRFEEALRSLYSVAPMGSFMRDVIAAALQDGGEGR